MSNCLQDLARKYLDAGVSIHPLRVDGTKSPALPSWHPYCERLATDAEIEQWFNRPAGIGLICGTISRGLEVIDFDMWQTFWPWFSQLDRGLQSRLAVVETPGGWHVFYRCVEICGSRKLAMWEEPRGVYQREHGNREGTNFESIGKGVRIETRGERAYVVGEGSPIETHASGLPYVHYCGPYLTDIQQVEPEQRRHMWASAMAFDCTRNRQSKAILRARRKAKQEVYGEYRSDEKEPWTWFDSHGPAIIDTMEADGWAMNGDGASLRRPGKTCGVSAVVSQNDAGEEVLTVFSTSAGSLSPINGEAHASFGKFALLVKLKFGGDRKAAARHVRGIMRNCHAS